MRWPWVFSILVGSAAAEADPPGATRPRASHNVEFWREVVEPHADEVQAILGKAREAMARPDNAVNGDTDWAVEPRRRFYRDAFHMLAYARTLSPHNLEVLTLYGRAADELGRTREAIEALETCAKLSGDRIPADVAGRLGTIYLRLGETATAIRWLRLAQGPLTAASVSGIVHLSSALAARGEIAAAIDVLTNAMPSTTLGHYTNEMTMAMFALAVLYDRDEQRSAAFTVIDQMQTTLQLQYGSYVQNELAKLRFAHPEDVHYYRGLLYESLGQYVEARAEWAHYAASGAGSGTAAGDVPWRRRALDHIEAMDAQRRALPTKPAASAAPRVTLPPGPLP